MHDHIHFRDVTIGRRFKFDGERFEKTAEKICVEYHECECAVQRVVFSRRRIRQSGELNVSY